MVDKASVRAIINIFSTKNLRPAGARCVRTIFSNFFFRQYRAVFSPQKIPVFFVDHPLDASIPFDPAKVNTYLDFVAFWLRPLGTILKKYPETGIDPVLDFISSMERLYRFAAEVYSRSLSTTDRPHYKANFHFALIHALDPHLLCIPSLHVMIAVFTYTKYRKLLQSLGEEPGTEIRDGALAITESVLYVKQHSVNCIAAALYAMHRFDQTLFPAEEGKHFVTDLFAGDEKLPDRDRIRNYIIELYTQFCESGTAASMWMDPLLEFLKAMPRRSGRT
ncbi:hypothetical protein FACS1894172_20750 [Spirochaetia bacterium]|nr:hypothetical protein FACS1894164_05040 [Spirochaetia bacterium]GHU37367.1 hypothetical protein FACS1894172_20750 [Spirochaetia bacterium]